MQESADLGAACCSQQPTHNSHPFQHFIRVKINRFHTYILLLRNDRLPLQVFPPQAYYAHATQTRDRRGAIPHLALHYRSHTHFRHLLLQNKQAYSFLLFFFPVISYPFWMSVLLFNFSSSREQRIKYTLQSSQNLISTQHIPLLKLGDPASFLKGQVRVT